MNEIINAIAGFIEDWANADTSPEYSVKNWGFVELANRESKSKKSSGRDNSAGVSTQPIPMTINGTGERLQVSLDDQYEFIEWIRVPGQIQLIADESENWGLKEGKRNQLGLRIVIAHRVELGENLIVELVNALPASLILSGFEFVYLSVNGDVDFDHEAIYKTELGDTVYEKHRFDWNLYVINLNVEFIPC